MLTSSLHDRFQKLISQLEIHGAFVSKEDINQKFLRSLPPSWSQIALIMRNKPDIDEVDIVFTFTTIVGNYDTEREKHNKAKLEIRGYEIALESLEARILGHEKNELAWGERYEFQNYDLKCREIKINNLNLELEKVVKERDELKLKIEKWEGSSKNLTKILNSQMNAHDKNVLGFGTQKDDLSNKSETDSENSLTIFEVRSSDEESTLANNRFTKANEYHVVPPPITGNPLTLRADISFTRLDEYAFRNKIIESNTTETNKTVGTTNEATILKPKSVNETVVSKEKVNRDEVIIKDWTSDDEEDGNPEICLQDHTVMDSGCSSHMTSNKAYLSYYEDYNGGFVAFGSDPKGDELNFKLLDENQVVLRAPRQNGVYSLDLKNIVPSGGITCLYANATTDESKLWHRRLGHVNFKNINKLVKGHLVRGLPSKVFVNDHTCVACKKGKQHKASCKAKLERTIRKPLELLHMDNLDCLM
ncbi:putative ribonuclease H-like domain-containing protein [Tanacetum coccineum]|uniref:Ribonuclease H-like domain-containing protein n=1 Tax=Tanacetum coccineum TaxID=301880 RepID=A0ABQ5CXV3_9ASTR